MPERVEEIPEEAVEATAREQWTRRRVLAADGHGGSMVAEWKPVVLSREEVSGHSPISGDRPGEESMTYVPLGDPGQISDALVQIAAEAAFVPPIAEVRIKYMRAALESVAPYIRQQVLAQVREVIEARADREEQNASALTSELLPKERDEAELARVTCCEILDLLASLDQQSTEREGDG